MEVDKKLNQADRMKKMGRGPAALFEEDNEYSAEDIV